MDDALDSLDAIPASSSVSASDLDPTPGPFENYTQAAQRVSNATGAALSQTRQLGRVKAADFTSRGIPYTTDATGDTSALTDWTGAALTSADPRNKVAYDSTGNPVDYNQRNTQTGKPVVQDAFSNTPVTTDPKTGDQYKIHAGLPWQYQGQDPDIAAANAQAQQATINQQTNAALAAPEADAQKVVRNMAGQAKLSAKNTGKTLSSLGVPLTDETGNALDLSDIDAPTLQQHIESSFNQLYAAPEANATPLFGGGEYSKDAQAIRTDLDNRKQQAMQAAVAHVGVLNQYQQAQDNLDQISSTRQSLAADRLATVNQKRAAAGMAPVTIPGMEEHATASDLNAPAQPAPGIPGLGASSPAAALSAQPQPQDQSAAGTTQGATSANPTLDASQSQPITGLENVATRASLVAGKSFENGIRGVMELAKTNPSISPAAWLLDKFGQSDKISDALKARADKMDAALAGQPEIGTSGKQESLAPTNAAGNLTANVVGGLIGNAPGIAAGGIPGLVALGTQSMGEAAASAHDQAKQQGASDDEAANAASTAALKTLPTTALYALTGKATSSVLSKIIPLEASPLSRAAAALVAGTGANIAAGAVGKGVVGENPTPTVDDAVNAVIFAAHGASTEHQTAQDLATAKSIINGTHPEMGIMDGIAEGKVGQATPEQQQSAAQYANALRAVARDYIEKAGYKAPLDSQAETPAASTESKPAEKPVQGRVVESQTPAAQPPPVPQAEPAESQPPPLPVQSEKPIQEKSAESSTQPEIDRLQKQVTDSTLLRDQASREGNGMAVAIHDKERADAQNELNQLQTSATPSTPPAEPETTQAKTPSATPPKTTEAPQTETASKEASPSVAASDSSTEPTTEKPNPATVDDAAHEAATSPLSGEPMPTPAQVEAGNHLVGRAKIGPLQISVQHSQGSELPEGTPATVHKGWIRGTQTGTGENMPVMVKPGISTDYQGPVHVVNNPAPDGKAEHTAVIGAQSPHEAVALHNENSPTQSKVGDVATFKTVQAFHDWASKSGHAAPAKGDLPLHVPGLEPTVEHAANTKDQAGKSPATSGSSIEQSEGDRPPATDSAAVREHQDANASGAELGSTRPTGKDSFSDLGKLTKPNEAKQIALLYNRDNRKVLDALGISKINFGDTSVASGAEFDHENHQINLSPEKAAQAMDAVRTATKDPARGKAWLQATLDHEAIHAAQNKVAEANGTTLDALYTDGWKPSDMPDDLKEAARKYYGPEWDEKPEWQQRAEAVRMVVEDRWKGKITEAIYKAVSDLRDFFKKLLGLHPESDMLKRQVEATEEILKKAGAAEVNKIGFSDLKTALRDPSTGKMIVGNKGEDHYTIYNQLSDDGKKQLGLDKGSAQSREINYDNRGWVTDNGRFITLRDLKASGGDVDAAAKTAKFLNKDAETTPAAESVTTPEKPALTEGAKVRVGNSPQLHTITEELAPQKGDLPDEKYFKVTNDKTGREQTVEAKDITPVKERTAEEKQSAKAASEKTTQTLDKKLRDAGMDPSVFPDVTSKRAALERKKALGAATPDDKSKELWRSSDDPIARKGAHFSDNQMDANAYRDNPGFGGNNVNKYRVDLSRVVNAPTIHSLAEHLEPLLNNAQREWSDQNGGLESAIRGYGFDHVFHALENVFGPRGSRIDPVELLAKDNDWIKFKDDFPEDADTYKYIGDSLLHPEGDSVNGPNKDGIPRSGAAGDTVRANSKNTPSDAGVNHSFLPTDGIVTHPNEEMVDALKEYQLSHVAGEANAISHETDEPKKALGAASPNDGTPSKESTPSGDARLSKETAERFAKEIYSGRPSPIDTRSQSSFTDERAPLENNPFGPIPVDGEYEPRPSEKVVSRADENGISHFSEVNSSKGYRRHRFVRVVNGEPVSVAMVNEHLPSKLGDPFPWTPEKPGSSSLYYAYTKEGRRGNGYASDLMIAADRAMGNQNPLNPDYSNTEKMRRAMGRAIGSPISDGKSKEAATPESKEKSPLESRPESLSREGASTEDTGKPEEGKTGAERLIRQADEAGLSYSLETLKKLMRGEDREPQTFARIRAQLKAVGKEPLGAGNPIRSLYDKAAATIQSAKDEIKSAGTRDAVVHKFDSTNTISNYEGGKAASSIKLDLPNAKDREAMPFVIEAGGDKAKLMQAKAKVAASKDPNLAKKYAPVLDRAVADFDRLNDARKNHDALMEANHAKLTAGGVDVGHVEDYVTRKLDEPENARQMLPSPLFGMGGGQGSSPKYFTKGRAFETLADAIQAGYRPKSTDLADLDQHRIEAGEKILERKKYIDNLKATPAPTDGKPIIGKLETRNTLSGKTEQVVPKGYRVVNWQGTPLVVHDQFSDTFRNLGGHSAIRANPAGRALLKFAAAGKHGTLVFDTFHVGRLLFKMANAGGGMPVTMRDGKPAWNIHKGLSLLEYSDNDLNRAVQQKIVTPKEAAYARKNRPMAEELMRAGLNVGKVADNLMEQAKLKLPIVSKLNDWIFQKVARGAMIQTALNAFERNLKQPGMTREQAARQTAKEMNEYFGNLQNQGLFTNKTLQDVALLTFLAPQWTESQAKYEGRAYAQAAKSGYRFAKSGGKDRFVGNSTRAMVAGFAALLAVNQILNYFSRKKTTMENPEDGHKLDAWLPGGKRGFWLDPAEISAEYFHAAEKYFAQHENPVDIGSHIVSNKLSPLARGVKEGLTGRDYAGRHFLNNSDRFRAAIVDALPSPLPLGAVLEKDPRQPLGYRFNRQPGAVEKQLLQSAGAKVTAAQAPRTQMFAIAQPYRADRGQTDNAGEYTELRRALDNDNKEGARSEIQWLQSQGKPMDSIAKAVGWTKANTVKPEMFAGSQEREAEMLQHLTPAQKTVYQDAQRDHLANAIKFQQWSQGMNQPRGAIASLPKSRMFAGFQ